MTMIKLQLEGADLVIKNLAEIQSPELRKRILNKAARQVIRSAKARVSAQTDLDGKAFGKYTDTTHHTRPRRRNMLARLVRRLTTLDVTDFGITVGLARKRDENIAAKHQFGDVITFNKSWVTPERTGDRRDLGYYGLPATRKQAKALLAAGYKVKRKKGGLWTPSIKWITQNMTIAKAGAIIRVLRGSKDSWETTLPARPFLGITEDDLKQILDAINAEIKTALNQGAL